MSRLQIIIYPPSEEIKTAIEAKAAALGMSISQYLIFVGLNADIKVNVKDGGENE